MRFLVRSSITDILDGKLFLQEEKKAATTSRLVAWGRIFDIHSS